MEGQGAVDGATLPAIAGTACCRRTVCVSVFSAGGPTGNAAMGAKLLVERASWTLVDQGVVSAGNFLLNVLLARTLSEADYGEFVLFLGAIYILRTFDYSFISYPLSIRACVVTEDEHGRLLGNAALLALLLSVVLVVI